MRWSSSLLYLLLFAGCHSDPVDDAIDVADLAITSPDLGLAVAPDLATPPAPDDGLAPPPPYLPIDGGGTLGIVELVSPAVCPTENGRLAHCDFGTPTVPAPPTTEATPWSTIVTTSSR